MGQRCLGTWYLRYQKKQDSQERQGEEMLRGLESDFQRRLFLCVANPVNRSFIDMEVTQPTPSTPVPTAGVAVGNRGETLGRRGGERQGTQRPEEEEISRGKKTD